MPNPPDPTPAEETLDFIREIVADDVRSGRRQTVVTRFPPEPNGYLHVGHAKSICLNFGVAQEFGGHTNLRFDDTNPTKEEQEYIDSIKADVRWLGFDWGRTSTTPRITSTSSTSGRCCSSARGGPTSTTSPRTRSASTEARSPSRARRARSATARWRRTSTCSRRCARASSRT